MRRRDETRLAALEKIDANTVKMTLKVPNVTMLANLAMDFAAIHSAEYADMLAKAGKKEQFDQIPVGTGSFSFVDYQKDAVIRFKEQGTGGIPRGLEEPPFVKTFKAHGVDIVHLAEFRVAAHQRQPFQRHRARPRSDGPPDRPRLLCRGDARQHRRAA